jgi:hypothetical protein
MFTKNQDVKQTFNLYSGAEIFDGYTAKGEEYPRNGAVIAVFDKNGVRILTIGMTKYENSNIWEALHETSDMPLQTDPSKPPGVPYVADRIELGAVYNLAAMSWTGDFSKCMAWIYLAPEVIR